MNKCVIVFLAQFIYASAWVINNVNIEGLARHMHENIDDFNTISPLSVENNDITVRFSLIYPGTKWCGAGDIANDFNDLGTEWRADMCCRDHDYCPDTIPAGATKYNLTNDAFYTRLSCTCDESFRLCLQNANSRTAENIGILYFNALKTKCFREDFPVLKCLKRGGAERVHFNAQSFPLDNLLVEIQDKWLNKKCLVYSYNTTAPMVYQWFDVNNYR